VKRTVQAAILCGGRGERLRPLTDYFQKAMVPVGPKKLPLLAYVIKIMARHGVPKVALLTGYRSDDIEQYFGDSAESGVELTYSRDRRGRSGSLNAVAGAMENGVISKCDELLIYYGDVLTDLDITSLLTAHRRKRADATLVLARGYALPVGTARVSGAGLVTRFQEKPRLDLSVTTGCMVVGPKAMSLIRRLAGAENTDLMAHFLPKLLDGGGKIAAFYTEDEWFDVGTLASFERLDAALGQSPRSFLPWA